MNKLPLRPRNYRYDHTKTHQEECTCGHDKYKHDAVDRHTLGMFPTYDYYTCQICMCSEYEKGKEYTMRLD